MGGGVEAEICVLELTGFLGASVWFFLFSPVGFKGNLSLLDFFPGDFSKWREGSASFFWGAKPFWGGETHVLGLVGSDSP